MQTLHPAYVAGLFDGEGSAIFNRTSAQLSRLGYRYYPYVCLTLVKGWEVLNDLQAQYGGHVMLTTKPIDPDHNRGHRWYLTQAKDVLVFGEEILPYLRVKNKQMEVLVRYVRYRMSRPHFYSPEMLEVGEGAWMIVRYLNRRGSALQKLG